MTLSEKLLEARAARAAVYLEKHGIMDGFPAEWAAVQDLELARLHIAPQQKPVSEMTPREKAALYDELGAAGYAAKLREARQ